MARGEAEIGGQRMTRPQRRPASLRAFPKLGLVMRWPGFRLFALSEPTGELSAYRNQPERRSHRQTNGCHHGRRGRNAGGQPHARQNCTGNDTRWK